MPEINERRKRGSSLWGIDEAYQRISDIIVT
jgi:hypothetical protein